MAKGEGTQAYAKPKPHAPFRPRTAEAKPVNRKKSAQPLRRAQVEPPKIRRAPQPSRPLATALPLSDEAAPFSSVPSAPRRV